MNPPGCTPRRHNPALPPGDSFSPAGRFQGTPTYIPCRRGHPFTLVVTPSRGQAVRATFELECRRANQSVLLSYVDHDGSVAQVRPYLNPYLTLYLTPYLMDHDGSVAQVRPYLTLNHILAPYFTLYLTPYLMDHDGSVAQPTF